MLLLKFAATWITAWSGAPGGIFAPALAIGGALGGDVAQLTGHFDAPTLIALGMAGFLAAVTQAPMTAFIIVMEMVDGYQLVLSLMACAMIASGTTIDVAARASAPAAGVGTGSGAIVGTLRAELTDDDDATLAQRAAEGIATVPAATAAACAPTPALA